MTIKSTRLDEFVKYHNGVDGECNGIVLQGYADKHKLSPEERVALCFFFAVTYCVESSIVMLLNRHDIAEDPEKWAESNKGKLIFQSDRRYMRCKQRFAECLLYYAINKPKIEAISLESPINLPESIKAVEKWKNFGRFSAYLFLETCAWVMHSEVINAEMDWKNGDTATSGLLNIYGLDEAADMFDKYEKLPKELTQERMQEMVAPILAEIAKHGGDNNITKVETSLCAYRKFFKGTRYNGYYLDRMLEEIYAMKNDFPQISQELFEIRNSRFDAKYLGEQSGWKGIRKECKKLYKESHIMM